MSLLAASFLLSSFFAPPQSDGLPVAGTGGIQARQIPDLQTAEYRQLLPSLASLVVQGQVVGTAVLIDKSGLYLASKDSVVSREVEAVFSNRQKGHVSLVSEDPWTQLVLLRSDYVPPGAVPVTAASQTPAGTPLLVILQNGSVTARIVSDSRVGVVRPSSRVVPLSELRLELPGESLGNAPVFDTAGNFVGLLSASLTSNRPADSYSSLSKAYGVHDSTTLFSKNANKIGPANLAVAYVPSAEAMQVVIGGFLSASHVVEHASLGVFCSDGVGGALVREVVSDSAANQIGIRDGDLITGIGSYAIRNKSDFAKSLFKYRSGSRVMVRFDRDGRVQIKGAILGKSSD